MKLSSKYFLQKQNLIIDFLIMNFLIYILIFFIKNIYKSKEEMAKLLFKKHLCLKPKQPKRRVKYIKDKAIKNFLLQHMKPVKLDFSKLDNCLLNRLSREENIFQTLFPEINETNDETNSQVVYNLSAFKCKSNF